MAPPKQDLAKRFLSKIQKTDTCWLWIGSMWKNHGYGRIHIDDKDIRVHRFSYEFFIGPIPKSLLVCHKCDVRNCVRPDHLFLGTTKDNAQDRNRKNRQGNTFKAGWDNLPDGKLQKLTKEQVLEIRNKYKPFVYTHQMLADEYGISRSHIGGIIRGNFWK